MIDEEGRDVESTARHIPESLLQIDGARPRPLNRNISALDRDCGIALGRPVRADLADHQKAGLRIELPPVSAVPRRPGGAQDHVEVPGRILMELREILIAHRIYAAARLVGRRSEAHTSELQSIMSISYAVLCLT